MPKLVHRWIALVVILSLASHVDHGWVMRWLALSPDAVLHGELWRLVTWGLVVRTPLALAMVSWLIYRFGGELAQHWGEARLRTIAVELAVIAAIATCAIAIAIGEHGTQTCTTLTMMPLVILWGRMFPDRELFIYGVFPIKAARAVPLGLGIVVLFEIYYGLYAFAPELVACGLAALYPAGWLRR